MQHLPLPGKLRHNPATGTPAGHPAVLCSVNNSSSSALHGAETGESVNHGHFPTFPAKKKKPTPRQGSGLVQDSAVFSMRVFTFCTVAFPVLTEHPIGQKWFTHLTAPRGFLQFIPGSRASLLHSNYLINAARRPGGLGYRDFKFWSSRKPLSLQAPPPLSKTSRRRLLFLVHYLLIGCRHVETDFLCLCQGQSVTKPTNDKQHAVRREGSTYLKRKNPSLAPF